MTYTKPEKSVMDAFAARFSDLKKQYDLGDSFKTLGRHFGVSSPAVQKWAKAESMPKMENACLIALRYQVCVEWLLTGRGDIKMTSSDSELDAIMAQLSPESQARMIDTARAFLALQKQAQ